MALVPHLKTLPVSLPWAFSSLLFSCLFVGCGAEGQPEGVTPVKADYVLSVFELQPSLGRPCSALMDVSSDLLGDDGWAISFPDESQLLSVMGCLRSEEAVLYEGTGQIMGWGTSHAGWDLFSSRRSQGGGQVSVSGHGELSLSLGEKEGERVLFTDMQLRHVSGELSIDDKLRYEDVFPRNTSLLLYRFLDGQRSGPQLCLVLELQE